jgi:prophage regulatory protein
MSKLDVQGMRLLQYTDLCRLGIDYSSTQLWRLCKSGQFPAPIKLGARRNAWRESDIEAWLISRQTVAA